MKTFRNIFAVFAALVFAVFFYVTYPAPRDLIIYVVNFLGAAAIIIIYTMFGSGLLRAAGIKTSGFETFALSFGAAYAAMGIIMFLAGMFPAYNIFFAYGLALAICVVFAREAAVLYGSLAAGVRQLKRGNYTFREAAFACLLAAAGVYFALVVITPAVYYDSLVYHLALPSRYIAEGRLVDTPENIFSYFPQLHQMNGIFFSLITYETGVKALNLYMAILAVGATALAAKNAGGSSKAAVAAAITCPLLLLSSSRMGAELPLMFFTMLMLYGMGRRGRDGNSLILAGIFAGCAMGVKYTGVIVFIFFTGWAFTETLRKKIKPTAFLAAVCAGVLMVLPYLIRNYFFTADPFYPFFPGAFGLAGSRLNDAAAYVGHVGGFGSGKNILDFIVSPFKAVFERNAFGGDAVSPIIILGPVLALIFCAGQTAVMLLFWIFYYTVWFFTGSVLRFLTPLEMVSAAMAAAAFTRFGNGKGTAYLKWGAIAVFISVQAAAGIYFSEKYLRPWSVFVMSREDYMGKKITYYKAAAFLNNMKEKGRALFIGEARSAYCERAVMAYTVFNTRQYTGLIDAEGNGERFLTFLGANGIKFVMINFNEMERLKDSGFADVYGMCRSDGFKKFMDKNFQKLYSDENAEVYRLNSSLN
jgi:hypothetical protein